ncbi:MAG: methyltransferase domain-containing protein [Candidatus Aenigmatarchaeota archaeon]
MKILVLTGGFHEEMPYEELRALGVDIRQRDGRIVVGKTEDVNRLDGLGFSHLVLEFLGSFHMNETLPFNPSEHIQGKFAARFKNLDFEADFKGKKEEILEELNPSIDTVDLDEPDTTFYFLMRGTRIYTGKLLHRFEPAEFTKRKPALKPFSRPVSLQPREARCWVNLSGVEKGESLLDPFCGTGGILVEGALAGCKVYGSDSEGEMVSGSEINLDYYGLGGEMKRCKVQELEGRWDRKFDAVVTDPPYGRSAKVGGEKVRKLYMEAIPEIEKVLKQGKRCVIGAPERLEFEKILEDSENFFEITRKFREKVHGDLAREVFVLRRR